MAKSRAKLAIFLFVVLIAAPVGAGTLLLLSNFIASFNQGADPASIFRGHALVIPAADEARYLPLVGFAGREPTLGQREELLSAYWRGWVALGRAAETGDTADLPTYWAGQALAFARGAVQREQASVLGSAGHQVRLTYLSADGSVARLTDERFRVITPVGEVIVTAHVMMTLDNGFWRVRSIEMDYEA
ncbi:MAG: hypothetical protein AAF125_21580 [Chloroflexota bacterium]